MFQISVFKKRVESETQVKGDTLPETNISQSKGSWEDEFPFPLVGYLSSLEGKKTQEWCEKMLIMLRSLEWMWR